MPFWQHDEIRFRFRDKGKGLPFVFQHGLGSDADAPLALFPPPPGIRVICLDCRAHGETTPVGDPEKISFHAFADDIIALLDHLGIARAVIGGTSMGAGISLNLTLRYPERVRALVLSRAAWLDEPMPARDLYLRLAELIRTAATPEEGERAFRASREYRAMEAVIPAALNNLALEFHRPHAQERAMRFERMPLDAPSRDRRQWQKITVPTLVIVTRHDPVHPFEMGQEMASLIPGAQLLAVTAKSVDVAKHEAEVRKGLRSFLKGLRND